MLNWRIKGYIIIYLYSSKWYHNTQNNSYFLCHISDIIRIRGNIKQNHQEGLQISSNYVEFCIYTNQLDVVRYNTTHIGGAPT